ncbi:MAG: glycosyltransferase family 4 protein [Candidatus Erginobacter occultus]|nr:glycosyltransferase family 4 protein [Candidatus Erginobacter occultus]
MKPKVAMIFSQFPCYDEVFLLREMVELDSRLDLRVFSLKRPRRDPVQHSISKRLAGRTFYSALFAARTVLGENFRLGFSRPGLYLRLLGLVIRLNRSDPEFLLKSLILLPQAVYFARICRGQKVTRVHGQWATYPALTALVISRINGIPFSFTGHAHDIHVKTAGLADKIREADFVITCTEDNRRYLASLAPETAPEKIRVVYHGVDLSHYLPKSVPGGGAGEGGPFRILSVGSLFDCKGFEYLIAAGEILRRENFEFRCRIVGGGYLERRLRKMVEEKELNGYITFTGYQAQDEMPEHYRWSDLFILPAVLRIHWGIPNVLLESLAVGVPVACTPLPSLPELIEDPPCGFSIPERDPEAIAGLVRKVSRERELLETYGRAGRKKIEEKWDIKKTAAAIAALFGASPD